MADLNFKMIMSLVDKVTPELKKLEGNFKGFGGLIAGVAGGAVAGALATMVKATIDASDKLLDLSQQVGVSVENLSTMRYAAKMSGTDLDTFANGISILSKKLLDVDNPASRVGRVMNELGVQVKDAAGKTRDSFDIFLDFADALSKLPDGADKTAIAMGVMGGAGKELIPLLNEGKQGILDLQKQAEEMGLKLSKAAAEDAARFNDSLDKMTSNIGGVVQAGAGQLIPTLATIAETLTKNTVKGGGFVTVFKAINEVLKIVSLGVAVVYTGLEQLGLTLAAVAASAVLVAQGEFKQAGAVWGEWQKDIARTSQELVDFHANLNGGNDALRAKQAELDKAAASQKDFSKATEDARNKLADFLSTLKDEVATMGMSEAQKKRYTAAQLASTIASEAERKAFLAKANALVASMEARQKEIDAMEKQKKLKEEAAKKLEDEKKKLVEAIKSTKEFVEQLEFENTLYGLSNVERATAIKLREMENQGIKKGSKEYEELNGRMKEAMQIQSEQNRLEGLLSDTSSAKTKKFMDDLALLDKAYFEGINGVFISDEQYTQGVNKLTGIKDENKKTTDEITEFWKAAAQNIEGAMSGFFFDVMQGNITDLGSSMKKMIDKMVAEFLAAKAATMLFGADFGSGGSMGGIVGSLFSSFGGFRENGGDVRAGVPYIVGEKRPEVFVPQTNGTIIPSTNGLGGGDTYQVSITAMDTQSFRTAISKDKRFIADVLNKSNFDYNMR